ncbi:class I SAM-dependent methyltransferase [[Eubacterium] cellulosolvens]
MAITDPEIIKKIVRGNFDKSAEQYEQFESRFGLFEALTMELALSCKVHGGMCICDVGCGTGTSSFVLQKLVGSDGRVTGVDFSDEMLSIAKARQNKSSASNLDFVLGDANELDELIECELDCIMYNACIFLIPEPLKTLKTAQKILKDHGTVAMNYLIGIYDQLYYEEIPVSNLFQRAAHDGKTFAPYGRAITKVSELPELLNTLGYRNVRGGVVSIELPIDGIEAFYSIPAQSAALWPKQPFDERLTLLRSLLEYFREINVTKYYQYWGWQVGEK